MLSSTASIAIHGCMKLRLQFASIRFNGQPSVCKLCTSAITVLVLSAWAELGHLHKHCLQN